MCAQAQLRMFQAAACTLLLRQRFRHRLNAVLVGRELARLWVQVLVRARAQLQLQAHL